MNNFYNKYEYFTTKCTTIKYEWHLKIVEKCVRYQIFKIWQKILFLDTFLA